jgi:hypothetical protein
MFHDKQITLTGTSNKNIILNDDYNSNKDYFYPENIFLSMINNQNRETVHKNNLDNLLKRDNDIVVDAKDKNDRSDEKYEYIIPLSEQHNPDALKEFLNPSFNDINKPIEIIPNNNIPNQLNNDIISLLFTDSHKKIPDILTDLVYLDEQKRSGNILNKFRILIV